MFKELYEYRELLKTSVKKELRGKYKASVLGVLWSFINPLLQVLVYAIVFPYLMRSTGDNYLIYLVTGILPWTFFQTVVVQCVTSIKSNAAIIKKVYFPRAILPLASAISGFINFLISCIIIIAFCIGSGVGISWHIIFVPVIALLEGVLALGIGMALGAMDAYFQDLEYIVNFLLQLAMYGSPIIYRIDTFDPSSTIVKMIQLNPLTQIVNAYRDVFLYHTLPSATSIAILFVIALFVLIIGSAIFKKLEKGFAEQF